MLLKQIFSLFKLLNSETGTNQIAAGIACGLILGFAPVLSLQALLVFLCLFIFRIQIGAAFLAAFFFKFVAYVFDPILDTLGHAVLNSEVLKPLFTALYNMPIIPYTRFYNTVVMGSMVGTIVLFPFVFFLSKKLIAQYRIQFVQRFQNTKVWKLVKASYLYQWYAKYDQYFG